MTQAGTRRILRNGRSDTRLKPHKNSKIDGPFIMHYLEMRLSPAWNALKPNDKRVLERLEVEHMAHGGTENGNLIVTFSDFENSGINRHVIAPAIARLEALGFVECIDRGRASYAEFRRPSKYRITYLRGNLAVTDDWKKVRDLEHAQTLIDKAENAMRERTRSQRNRIKRAAEKRASAKVLAKGKTA